MLCYAKSLQSCLTLCDPIDGSLPGSPVPGILQARTQEWVAISFSNAWKWKVKVKSLSRVRLLATPWTTRLLHPWDFPGKSTGVGCHCGGGATKCSAGLRPLTLPHTLRKLWGWSNQVLCRTPPTDSPCITPLPLSHPLSGWELGPLRALPLLHRLFCRTSPWILPRPQKTTISCCEQMWQGGHPLCSRSASWPAGEGDGEKRSSCPRSPSIQPLSLSKINMCRFLTPLCSLSWWKSFLWSLLHPACYSHHSSPDGPLCWLTIIQGQEISSKT